MKLSVPDQLPHFQVTPGRAAAFGAAVGGLSAMMALSLLYGVLGDILGAAPTYVIVVLGAAVAWANARRKAD